MSLTLTNYKKIQEDYRRYQTAIDKINDPKAKLKANNLLSQYKAQINLINEAHSSSTTRNTNLTAVRDNVFELVNIRQRLEKFVKDAT